MLSQLDFYLLVLPYLITPYTTSSKKCHNSCKQADLLSCPFRGSKQSIFKVSTLLNSLFLTTFIRLNTISWPSPANYQHILTSQSPSATSFGPLVNLKNKKKNLRVSDQSYSKCGLQIYIGLALDYLKNLYAIKQVWKLRSSIQKLS